MTGPHLWTKTEGSITMTSATQSYNLVSTLNPVRVLSMRYRDTSSRDLPMEELSRDEYFDLPLKTSAGIPTQYFFDPQRGAPTLYVWPVKATITTETLRVTYQRRIEDIDSLDNDIDIPQEWFETLRYCLADRLLDEYGQSDGVAQRIMARAAQLRLQAEDFERDTFVQFGVGQH
jgi:hypothetical protein